MTFRKQSAGGSSLEGDAHGVASGGLQRARDVIGQAAAERLGVATIEEWLSSEPLYRSASLRVAANDSPDEVTFDPMLQAAFLGAAIEEIATRPGFGEVEETLIDVLLASADHADHFPVFHALAASSLCVFEVRRVSVGRVDLFDVVGEEGAMAAEPEAAHSAAFRFLTTGAHILGRLMRLPGGGRCILSATHLPLDARALERVREISAGVADSVERGASQLVSIAPGLGDKGALARLRRAGAMDAAPLLLALWLRMWSAPSES